jgi:hypothetical protein
MPDGWEYWDTQVFLFHTISITKKTKKYFFKGTCSLRWFLANSVPFGMERIYLKVFVFDLLLTKVGYDFAHLAL